MMPAMTQRRALACSGTTRGRGQSESARFRESPNAVVDYDSDHLNGDSKSRHPNQDDPNPPEAVFDDCANHLVISKVSASLFSFSSSLLH